MRTVSAEHRVHLQTTVRVVNINWTALTVTLEAEGKPYKLFVGDELDINLRSNITRSS